MSVALRITFKEYMRMIGEDAFRALRDRKIELIHGELREMTPPGPDHSGAVDWLNKWSVLSPPRDSVTVRVHNPIAISALDSAPQPDIVWAKPHHYRDRHPFPDDVLLCVEVADSSLEFDCGEKAQLYAAAGIRDYWVVDLQIRVVHMFRQPLAGEFVNQRTVRFGEELRPLAFPEVRLSLAELFTA